MKRIICALLILAMLIPCATAPAEGTGEPYGDGDGRTTHEKLAGMYRWLSLMDSKFWRYLPFDAVCSAVGVPGKDRNNGDGKSHGAQWTDEDGHTVVVGFKYYETEDTWGVSSISTSNMPREDLDGADISAFPHYPNRDTGASPTQAAELQAKGAPYAVTAQVPTEYWYAYADPFGAVNFCNYPWEKDAKYSQSFISVSFATPEAREKDMAGAKDLTELPDETFAGMTMHGVRYDSDKTEYYAFMPDGETLVRILFRRMLPLAGTEAEAIVNSLVLTKAE